MKALKIIKAMCYDCTFAEKADVVRMRFDRNLSAEEFAREYFGCSIKDGKLFAEQNYLYLYAVDGNDCSSAVVDMGKPDVVLRRINPADAEPDDQEVWLWKIE